jgi:hypothetical protein
MRHPMMPPAECGKIRRRMWSSAAHGNAMVYLGPFFIGTAPALSVFECALPTIPKRDFMFYRRRNRDPFSIP